MSCCPSAHSTTPYGLLSDLSYVHFRLFSRSLPFHCFPSKIGAIAAGNCVVLKPSELSPAISGLIAELIPKYLDNDVVRVVLGAVPETSKVCYSFLLGMECILIRSSSSWNTNGAMVCAIYYVCCRNYDARQLVLYTGSGRVAKLIGVAAAKTLSPISLEVNPYAQCDVLVPISP